MDIFSQRQTLCANNRWRLPLYLLLAMLSNIAFAAQNTPLKRELSDASLEELMSRKVSTVSRKLQTVKETAAAVFVIT